MTRLIGDYCNICAGGFILEPSGGNGFKSVFYHLLHYEYPHIVGDRRSGLLDKLDPEKAYDKVNWGLLQYMLQRIHFGAKRRKWIQECILSSSPL